MSVNGILAYANVQMAAEARLDLFGNQASTEALVFGNSRVGCCRFHRHLVKVENETGGCSWEREGNSAGNSSLRL